MRSPDMPNRRPAVAPEAYTNGVVTPHASFLALPFDRRD
jgi:hypothetical protein